MINSKHLLLASAAFSLCFSVSANAQDVQEAESDPVTPGAFQFDSTRYAQVRITMTGGGDPFVGNCPDKRTDFFDVSLGELIGGGGDRVASLTIKIDHPGDLPSQEFELIRIEQDGKGILGLGKRKCSIAFTEVNYLSPLFAMSSIENQPFTITVEMYQQEGGGGFFSNTMAEVIEASGSIPLLPSGALELVGTAMPTLIQIGGYEGTVRHTKSLNASQNELEPSKTWTIPSFDDEIEGEVVLTATLVSSENLFGVDTQSTNPGAVLQRSWDLGQPFPNLHGFLLQHASLNYANFNQSTTVEAARGACGPLFGQVDQMGLTAPDAAVLKWALIRGHPSLGDEPEMDDLGSCTSSLWTTLPVDDQGERPEAFTIREVIDKPTPPTAAAMTGVLTGESAALSTFLETSEFATRQSMGDLMFGDKFILELPEGFELLGKPLKQSVSVSELILAQWDIGRNLASDVGCFVTGTGDEGGVQEGEVWAVGTFLVGEEPDEREAVIKMRFSAVSEGAESGPRIASFTIEEPNEGTLALFRTRYASGQCAGGYSPSLLAEEAEDAAETINESEAEEPATPPS